MFNTETQVDPAKNANALLASFMAKSRQSAAQEPSEEDYYRELPEPVETSDIASTGATDAIVAKLDAQLAAAIDEAPTMPEIEAEPVIPMGDMDRFELLLAEITEYWDRDAAFLARSIRSAGVVNVQTVLNRMNKEGGRTTPPMRAEVTAIETSLWDNWPGGKRPKGTEPGHDRARYKATVEVFNQPDGSPIWGGGTKSANSIYDATAILMTPDQLSKYVADKLAGKGIKNAWTGDLAAFANELLALSQANPEALIGPLCWTKNKKTFNPGLAVMVRDIGGKPEATIMFPDGSITAKRWTKKRANNTPLPDNLTHQCRASNRNQDSAWRNAKIS